MAYMKGITDATFLKLISFLLDMAKHFLMGDFFTPTESAILSMKHFVPNTSSNLALTVVLLRFLVLLPL